MDAVSRVAGALAIALMSTVALAAEPPPYRAIVFEGDIGDGATFTGVGVTLDRWPSVDHEGDGLRFRFASERVVVGNIYQDVGGTDSVWAARWQLGHKSSRALLKSPEGALGTVVADANLDGAVVGAVVMPTSSPWSVSVQAAAWAFPSGDLVGDPAPKLVFGPSGIADCYGTVPDTMLSAVGPRAASSESAMVAGIGGLVRQGGSPDGFLGELQAGGVVDKLERLPGTSAADWCGTWVADPTTRCSFGQCVAWSGPQAPTVWDQFTVIGSTHELGSGSAVLCDDAKLWDFCQWTTSVQHLLIEHCRGCMSGGIIEPCAQVASDGLWMSSATNIRLNSFAPLQSDPAGARPLALGGAMGVRTAPNNPQEICASEYCAVAHAAVLISSGGVPLEAMSLLDLHTVLVGDMDALSASGIARIYRWSSHDADDEPSHTWVAVGAVGDQFEPGAADQHRHGCFWLGRADGLGDTQWCALDANDLTIRPDGLTIEAIHDLNGCGLAVGVALQVVPDSLTTRHVVYLTEAADLNGDLVTDGWDLRLLMASWKSGCVENNMHDLDGDGCVGETDLGLLIAAWDGNGPGCAASVALTCQGSAWRSPLERYPYITMAAQALGFESLDDLGTTLSLLPPESATGLCELVDVVANALEGGQ